MAAFAEVTSPAAIVGCDLDADLVGGFCDAFGISLNR
jgi:phosphohistidine swiveling domain-containing protein